jgi:methionyl-tRNA formyltransferase
VVDSLLKLERGQIVPRPQDKSLTSSAPLLKKEHGRLDWSFDAQNIYNRIRGFDPWPGAYTFFRGHHCRIWGRVSQSKIPSGDNALPGAIILRLDEICVACGINTFLTLEAVQMEGRNRVTARDFLNGAKLMPGESFDSSGVS